MIKPPTFWFQKTSFLKLCLKPLSWIYQCIHGLNWFFKRSKESEIPILCIGNTGVGGAGKTPTALAVGDLLRKLGLSYKYLSRGYGGKELGPIVVQPAYHTAQQVGDEPLLLAKNAITVVAKKRILGLSFIRKKDTQAIIMDDGYQNPSLKKDLNILVIDGKRGFGNGAVFPAGPLREPLSWSLKRADAVVLVGDPSEEVALQLERLDCPIFKSHIKIQLPQEMAKKVYAFAGIAFPEKFFDSLREEGIDIIESKGFPDHAPYDDLEIKAMYREARKQELSLVTTEKDYMRMTLAQKKFVTPVPAALHWENKKAVTQFLKDHLGV